MPLVSKIVEIDGKPLLDGGIADSIPVNFFESIGYDRNIVVLTQPLDYRKGKNRMMPFIRAKYKKYPNFVDTAQRRHENYNETLDYIKKREERGELLVIRPPYDLPIGKVEKDPEKLKKAYDIGREVAEKRINEIKDYLK